MLEKKCTLPTITKDINTHLVSSEPLAAVVVLARGVSCLRGLEPHSWTYRRA